MARQLMLSLPLAALLFSGACSRTMGPRGLSETTYVATKKAVAALESASENRNASASIFDPKLLAASQAADEVYNDMGNQGADGYAASVVRGCIGELKVYRSNFDSRESDSRPIEQQLKGLKGAQMKDETDLIARSAKDVDDCIQAAKAYL